jgi:hypothetical protein
MRARISFPFRAIRRAQEASDVRQAGHQLLVERAVSLPLDAISARFAAVRSYWSSQALPVPAAIEQLYLNALDVA